MKTKLIALSLAALCAAALCATSCASLGARAAGPGGNQIRNPDFAQATLGDKSQFWEFATQSKANTVSFDPSQSSNGANPLRLQILEPGSVTWEPNVRVVGLEVAKGRQYTYAAVMRADRPTMVNIGVRRLHAEVFFGQRDVEVGTEWREYSLTVTASESNRGDVTVLTSLGYSPATVWIGKASFSEARLASEVYAYRSQGNPELVPTGKGINDYDSGTALDLAWTGAAARSPSIHLSGTDSAWGGGYPACCLAFSGLAPELPTARYSYLVFKLKSSDFSSFGFFLNNDKAAGPARGSLPLSAYSTELGDGWLQVRVPLKEVAKLPASVSNLFLGFEPGTGSGALTDVGFTSE